jgi:ELWxxDGT repeat protein
MGPAVLWDGAVYYAGYDATGTDIELFRFDTSGTTRVTDTNPGGSDAIQQLALGQLGVAFLADDGGVGRKLWLFDGNAVTRLADVNSGASDSVGRIWPVGTSIYFTAGPASNVLKLYRFDGASTVQLTDFRPGRGDFINTLMSPDDDRIFFTGQTALGGTVLYTY